MLGAEYVIEHCYNSYDAYVEEFGYKIYTSDMLLFIARYLGLEDDTRYIDLIQKEDEETEELSADEIALGVIRRAGLEVKK